MSSLDAELVKAGATLGSSEARGEGDGKEGQVTVEDVKKEIRGLKGLLLSRYVRPPLSLILSWSWS